MHLQSGNVVEKDYIQSLKARPFCTDWSVTNVAKETLFAPAQKSYSASRLRAMQTSFSNDLHLIVGGERDKKQSKYGAFFSVINMQWNCARSLLPDCTELYSRHGGKVS